MADSMEKGAKELFSENDLTVVPAHVVHRLRRDRVRYAIIDRGEIEHDATREVES